MKTNLFFKNIFLTVLGGFFTATAHLPTPVSVGANIKNWQAHATAETANGFLVVGSQMLSETRSRLVVVNTDSMGHSRWTRTYPHFKGLVAGYGAAATDSNGIFIAGSQNGIAKLWNLNAKGRGDTKWSMDLDSGLTRSVSVSSKNQLVVTVEHAGKLKVTCLSQAGKINWERCFQNHSQAKSSVLATREGYIMVAFAGHGVALDSTGKVFWKYHNETAHWKGMYQRANGEVVLFGHQKMQLFGPANEEAFVVSVRPLANRFDWFRSYGKEETFDAAYAMAERPNGQLILLAKQDKRIRLLELNQNHAVAKSGWITDSLCSLRYRAVGILNQSAWQDKWLIAYNRSDGTVWLQPTRQTIRPGLETTNLEFHLTLTDSTQKQIRLLPVAEIPITYRIQSKYPQNYFVHFNRCKGDGYAYLLSYTKAKTPQWEELGWVQLGSRDSLSLPSGPEVTRYVLLVANRPFAAPLRVLLDSDAYRADSLSPHEPAKSLSEQYPDTFSNLLQVNISADGGQFEIKNLPPSGWIPIVLNNTVKNNLQKR